MSTDLTDPEVMPNPAIRKLMDLNYEIFRLSMDENFSVDVRYYYSEALLCIQEAVGSLMRVKNRMAGE